MTQHEFLQDSPEIREFQVGEKPGRKIWKILLISFLGLVGFILFAAASLYFLFFILPYGPERALSRNSGASAGETVTVASADMAKISKEMAALEKKIDKLTHQGPYLIVNTTENKFYLYAENKLVRQGVCSTGKNEKLIAGKKEFRFKTPRGVHKVLRKQKDPVWAKPDWAFIEEGEPIPPPGHPSRFDDSTLGPYKLEIGDGYMVHGTVWKRFMGQSVTHGCIRLLDDDLEAVYNTLPIGSKVIIY